MRPQHQLRDDTPVRVIRTWKKDGTENEMSLGAALYNLEHNAIPAADRVAANLTSRLMAGETLQTRWATFRVIFG